MRNKLFVYSESDSFREFYEETARDSDLELEIGADLGRASPAAVVVVSMPGAEERASDRVRDAIAGIPEAPAVVGAVSDHRLAVDVVRAGAEDYFVLPDEAERLRDYVKAKGDVQRSLEARARLAEAERREFDFSQIVGESDIVREALALAARIIPRGTTTVLLTGETGTGKELLAQAIHYNGPRAEGPFVELNCSAIPANLLESELFGYERGAFTDAKRAKPGLLEVADGGALFLDEVGEMPYELQGKLLKVIEDKKVRRVGGTRTQEVDVRIIAATNRDLAVEVKAGRFREDLYYRLSVIPLHLPPLRDRGDDIVLLAEHFLDSLSQEYGVPRPEVTAPLKDLLVTHSWPGNVREMRNAVERALLLGEGKELRADDLFIQHESAPVAKSGSEALPFPATMEAIELAAVKAMLAHASGNKSAAARRLGISRSRLHRAIKRLAELDTDSDSG